MDEKSLKDQILDDLHRVHLEIGFFPSRRQYREYGKFSSSQIENVFGSWTSMTLATGASHTEGRKRREEVRGELAEKIRTDASSRREQRLSDPPFLASRILVISDMHAPYHHPDAINFLKALNAKFKFDAVVNIGDEVDQHALSFHDHDPDLLSAGHELDKAIKTLQELYKEFPVMKICESNHGSLLYRKGLHHGIPRVMLKDYNEVLGAPKEWHWDFEHKLQMSNGEFVLFHHSYGANVLLQSQRRGMSLVQGHHHTKLGAQTWSNLNRTFFAAQTGCLIDDFSMAFRYNKNNIERPLLGVIGIFNGHAVTLPMETDPVHNRWTGKILPY
jgi:hypothetical protein